MIQINLVPDVKQQLIQAQRVRATVISFAVLIGIAAVTIVVLLAIYVFGAQTARSFFSDNTIKSENTKLEKVPDLTNMLTIQNQMTKINETHDQKHINSRLFDILEAINPSAPNDVTFSQLKLDTENTTLLVEGQAANGYGALEVFKKTILNTKFHYTDENGDKQTVPLTNSISIGESGYGEDAEGRKVLRFTLTLVYPDEIFANSSKDVSLQSPSQENATDSRIRLPESIFSDRARDTEGEQ